MSQVFFHFERTDAFHFPQDQLAKALESIVQKEERSTGDLNVIFCSDEYLLEVNRKYLQHDYYTDVITFDYQEEKVTGDVYVSVERVLDNAHQLEVSFEKELCRVMAHGVLHLVGYSDKSANEKTLMREKEEAYLPLFPDFSVPRGTFPT